MPLREKDIEVLILARDENTGDLDRNAVVEAFKRAGAKVVRTDHNIRLQFQGRHPTFRLTLHDLAADLLSHCKIS